jgi:3-phenylpropionate/cinnamic acid dioxygenase small subunit
VPQACDFLTRRVGGRPLIIATPDDIEVMELNQGNCAILPEDADDLTRIRSRVRQLTGDSAWAENPRSQTRRFITNVRVTAAGGATTTATANFLVHRCRMERISTLRANIDTSSSVITAASKLNAKRCSRRTRFARKGRLGIIV